MVLLEATGAEVFARVFVCTGLSVFSTTGEVGLVAAKSVFGGSWEKVQLASFSPQLAITEGSPLCRIVGYQLCLPQSPQLFGLVTKGALREEV